MTGPARRVLVALGGNAMTGPDGSATSLAQRNAIVVAMEPIADLVAQGVEVLLTHGNGPQVGNLLVKNELAAHEVPPVPLDWCDAQTQATVGFTVQNALEAALSARGVRRPTATLVTRTLVDADDPGFTRPTKPIGRYLTRDRAEPLIAAGQVWGDRGEKGWRRVVASPVPLEILDAPTAGLLLASGYVVVAAGGGGIPVVRGTDGALRGVEAVIDKDLSSALLARTLEVDLLLIATDVEHALLDFGTPRERVIGTVTVSQLQAYADDGQFGSGSMGPKVAAAIDFVRRGGQRAVITALPSIGPAVAGRVGTVVVPDP